ncbi:pyrroline-5-carboxylate reductase dimerization-domain-containing protein [Aspergillus avenaceus]|uniref:Pyrroline-5-carboxylate reductase dimerization-domain-containing protein n=1 Tax=Aspergillus avenaceus TaxID=36643 RepID=A0A5N6U6B2_ASPAV|nr:pyrroline-5-carboxylate reductase dimerization-domain-containing protein [Aspergillus avenaceus]
MSQTTLCMLGCGNLGLPILQSLVNSTTLPFTHYTACVKSEATKDRLTTTLSSFPNLSIARGSNVDAARDAGVIILAVDPSAVSAVLSEAGLSEAVAGKIVISVAAGWSRAQILDVLASGSKDGTENLPWVIRALPNIAAQIAESMTAIEVSDEYPVPGDVMGLAEGIFGTLGKTARVAPSLMDAATAVAGSTPAFFAVIVDAMVDAAVAVGVPRDMALTMVVQAMRGTAGLMGSGVSPAALRDQGTSPEGCTIGGLMVLEERGVRGGVGRALREAVTVARRMDGRSHVNDTRE